MGEEKSVFSFLHHQNKTLNPNILSKKINIYLL